MCFDILLPFLIMFSKLFNGDGPLETCEFKMNKIKGPVSDDPSPTFCFKNVLLFNFKALIGYYSSTSTLNAVSIPI